MQKDLTYSGLEEVMGKAIKENWEFAMERNLTFRDACYVNAIRRVADCYKNAGIAI